MTLQTLKIKVIMNQEIIRDRASELKDKWDLLFLINDLLKEDQKEQDGKTSYLFSIRQLCYYCNPNHTAFTYRRFDIRKKTGGFRHITAPTRGLIHLQHYINMIFKAMYTPSDYAMGFTEGRSVVDNANKHVGQNYVFNTDLEDFFPSIPQSRVWKRLQLPPFNFNQEIAGMLAGLCCIKEGHRNGSGIYVLPQGAPTSPILTNAICDRLDHKLCGLARRFGLNYSRYADDITFSSMHNVYQEGSDFRKELERIIKNQNFKMNYSKTRLQNKDKRQEVTGLVVNSKVNVCKKYIYEIRNLLHIWERYGYDDAYECFLSYYKKEKGHVKQGLPNMTNVLMGKLMYLKMVKREDNQQYQNLYSRFRNIITNSAQQEEVNNNDEAENNEIEENENTMIILININSLNTIN